MRKILSALICAAFLLQAGMGFAEEKGVAIVDSLGNTAVLHPNDRVVSCHASLAQCWLLSGGTLAGVTEDAISERGLDIAEGTQIIGTVKSIDMEALVSAEPDYVLLSADLTAHLELQQTLDQMGIQYGYYREDAFSDYAAIMQQFCLVNDPTGSRYEEYVIQTQNRIQSVLDIVPTETDQSQLLLRAFSTGFKAKTDDNLAGQILKEFGLINIAEKTPSLLEDMSMEQILLEDPDYIFVITMGDEQAAKEYLLKNVENDPAWASLTAVQTGRYIVLPQYLFHYKPNNRWDESYLYLARILYPEVFEGEE